MQLTIVRKNEYENHSHLQSELVMSTSFTTTLSRVLALVGLALVGLALVGLPTLVLADPRLDEKVYSPYVLNGVSEVEVRTAQQLGGPTGGRATTVFEIEQGLNDRVSLSLVGIMVRGPGLSTRLAGLGLEGVVYLGRLPKLGVDTGLYLEYKKGLGGEDDIAEAKLLLAKTAGRFQGLLNIIIEHPLSAPRGQEIGAYGYAASVTWETVGHLRLGAQALGDFGDDHAFLGRQGAYVGPQIKWEGRPARSPVEIDIDAGWLKAVGTSRTEARSQLRFGIELEHRF